MVLASGSAIFMAVWYSCTAKQHSLQVHAAIRDPLANQAHCLSNTALIILLHLHRPEALRAGSSDGIMAMFTDSAAFSAEHILRGDVILVLTFP